ncbi:TPA: hypothetical protein MNK97_005588 [Klebsiella pneumoniae]|nr:hypothetical protein [Klebsiella pneumoniae]
MRKAIVIMATSVAFLLSGEAFAVRQTVDLPLEGELIRGAETVDTVSPGFKTYKAVPTTVPLGTKAVTVPVKAVRTVPTTSVTALARSGLKNNAASAMLNLTVMGAVAAVGWVMSDDNTRLQRSTTNVNGHPATPSDLDDPSGLCALPAAQTMNKISVLTNAQGALVAAYVGYQSTIPTGYDLFANNCTNSSLGYSGSWDEFAITGSLYPQVKYRVLAPGDYTQSKSELLESDWTILDGFIKGKDGVWQRDFSSGICDALPNPAACYEALSEPDTRVLTGPSTITAPPVTTTSTSSDGSSKTSTQTPTATVTYGDTWIDYNPITTTTTTTNNNNTTTTETETSEIPTVPDALGGINGPLAGLPGEISGQGSSIHGLGYSSWFSMGGQCKEHSFELPVVGVVTTNYCPIHEAYVRPFLAFVFYLWTWHYCFQIWRESVTRVRAD